VSRVRGNRRWGRSRSSRSSTIGYVVARRSFAVLVVLARCGLFLYVIGAKFFGAA
jgi:hypothetical protein